MSHLLDQLKAMTDVVADTGDIEAIKQYQPVDATTNPSLLYKAAQLPLYSALLEEAIRRAQATAGDTDSQIALTMDHLAVLIGCEIVSLIPGRISTEVDARLSFDTVATINKAKTLIELYNRQGIDRDRVLIKIAATWEGIRAAEVLEQQGINCNLTLLFSLTQAIACADAKVYLISPFVGRILDWYKNHTGRTDYTAADDPGVQSVTEIYQYYKQHGINTIIMGASFRNSGEILALAGCDRLTISPALLAELQDNTGVVERQLDPQSINQTMARITLDEARFRYQLNADAMATEKLAEGIRNFVADQVRLETLIREKINQSECVS